MNSGRPAWRNRCSYSMDRSASVAPTHRQRRVRSGGAVTAAFSRYWLVQPSRMESHMTIAIIVGVCVILAILAFLLPRLSTHPQRGVDSTLGTGRRRRRVRPRQARRWLRKPFQSSRKAANKSAEKGREGARRPLFDRPARQPRFGQGEADDVADRMRRIGADVAAFALDDIDSALAAGRRACSSSRGDGSLGHVAAASTRVGLPLAVIPTGTANDFARAAGIRSIPTRRSGSPSRATKHGASTRPHGRESVPERRELRTVAQGRRARVGPQEGTRPSGVRGGRCAPGSRPTRWHARSAVTGSSCSGVRRGR